jgi:hypothetical protein
LGSRRSGLAERMSLERLVMDPGFFVNGRGSRTSCLVSRGTVVVGRREMRLLVAGVGWLEEGSQIHRARMTATSSLSTLYSCSQILTIKSSLFLALGI